jgi:crotonobetainyl-CoA:carnitine CoA-transferase CaiB-like acyl-CoA transferase
MTAPLQGIRVLEVASWIAAPSVGALMADLGADVVKVEPPGGDAMRRMLRPPKVAEDSPLRGVDVPFQLDNRGKRSLAVALDRPEGAELIAEIVGHFDVLLTNLVPERQRRYHLDPETLLARHARLVHASVSGYGSAGPESWRPGFDVTAFFSWGGVAATTSSDPDGLPARFGAGHGDHTTGLALFGAILAALRLRDLTGKGSPVEVSLVRTGVWTQATDVQAALIDGRKPPRSGRGRYVSPMLNPFRCGDGRWVQFAMPNSDANWRRFCEAIDRPDLTGDERFAAARGRFRRQDELLAVLDPVFASRTRAEWAACFDRADLIWAPVNDIEDIVADPHLREVGTFGVIDHPVGGRIETVNPPFVIHDADVGVRGPAPEIGQHSDEVLLESGLSTAERDRLRAAGVVGAAGAGVVPTTG